MAVALILYSILSDTTTAGNAPVAVVKVSVPLVMLQEVAITPVSGP